MEKIQLIGVLSVIILISGCSLQYTNGYKDNLEEDSLKIEKGQVLKKDYSSYVNIVNSKWKVQGSKYYYIIGEFKNEGDSTITYIDMDATIYNNGEFFDTCFGYARDVYVPPGQKDTFEIVCDKSDTSYTYKINIRNIKTS